MGKREFSQIFPYLFICLIFGSAIVNLLFMLGLVDKSLVNICFFIVMAGNLYNIIKGMKNPLVKKKNNKPVAVLTLLSVLAWLATFIATLLK